MNSVTDKPFPDNIEAFKQQWFEREQVLLEKDKTLKERDETLKEKDGKILLLEEYIRYLKHKQFGQSSERDSPQAELFNEAESLIHEADVDSDPVETDTSIEAADNTDSQSKKRQPGRRKLPAHRARFKIYHSLNEQETRCECGCQMQPFDEVISEQLGIIPAELYVILHCRKKYSCHQCEQGVKTAPIPPQPIPKSNASPELLAHIVVSKFLDGLPFYRQEKIWERLDIDLPRATQANWSIRAGGTLVQPLINLLKEHSREGPVMHIDETPVQVLKEVGRSPTGKKYFWVLAGGTPEQPVLLFHYDPSRGTDVALSLIDDYRGVLISDDRHIYDRACDRLGITHIACNDHARRKFKEAKDSEPAIKGKHKISKADVALNYYRKLYAIERRIKGLPADDKHLIRQAESVPVWQAFKGWIDKSLPHIVPQSKLGKAIGYTDKLLNKLSYYCEDGHLPISNERAENAIRPFAIARKNFLFFDTPKGATASANLYSLIMSAKANDLNPFFYLAHVFKELPGAKTLEDIEALLPWHIDGDKIKKSFGFHNSPVV